MSEEKVDDMKMCCASCGVAEVDDIKLMECADCDLVDTAVMRVSRITNLNTKKHAKNERLNYVTNYYSSSRKAAIMGTAQFA